MMLVPTYLAPSSIHGIGLFTPFFLPADSIIWKFDEEIDWRLTPEEMAAFPESLQEQLRAWCFEERDGRFVLCGDNAKFMNHSFSPNCWDDHGPLTRTVRDIQPDEELTCDYRLFDAESARTGLAEWLESAHGRAPATAGAR